MVIYDVSKQIIQNVLINLKKTEKKEQLIYIDNNTLIHTHTSNYTVKNNHVNK